MNCIKCGSENYPEAKFCRSCGASLEEQRKVAAIAEEERRKLAVEEERRLAQQQKEQQERIAKEWERRFRLLRDILWGNRLRSLAILAALVMSFIVGNIFVSKEAERRESERIASAEVIGPASGNSFSSIPLKNGGYIETSMSCSDVSKFDADNSTLVWFNTKTFKQGMSSDIWPLRTEQPDVYKSERINDGSSAVAITVINSSEFSWSAAGRKARRYRLCPESPLLAKWFQTIGANCGC